MNENYEDYEDEKELKTDDYEDYEDNIDDYENDEENKNKRKRILLIILVIIGIIIIILLLTRCGRGAQKEKEFDIEKTLLEAGKEYYENNQNEIPKAKSSCTTVSLNKLVADGLLNPDKYADCESEGTYVKVCRLSNDKIHYVPILKCESFNSDDKYEAWKEGKLDDIIADETDVKFAYMGQILRTNENTTYGNTKEIWYGEEESPFANYKTLDKTTYYRYRDLQYRWIDTIKLYYPTNSTRPGNVFYISSPANEYTNKDNEQTGSKWYKVTSPGTKVYYDGYSETAPDGYPNKDTSQSYTIKSKKRTFTQTGTLESWPALPIYVCGENASVSIFSEEYFPCGSDNNAEPTHTYQKRMYYACDTSSPEIAQGTMCYECSSGALNDPKTACGTYGAWTDERTICAVESDTCVNYVPQKTFYKWYKYTNEVRSYYPTGSATASGENTYYLSAPAAGYLQDTTTTTKVWSWYKKASSLTEGYFTTPPTPTSVKSEYSRWTDWSEWSTTPIEGLGNLGTRSIQNRIKLKIQEIKSTKKSDFENIMDGYTFDVGELVKAFKTKKYNVNSLEDIALNGELKYLTKLYVRNK